MPTLCHLPGCNRTAGTCAECIQKLTGENVTGCCISADMLPPGAADNLQPGTAPKVTMADIEAEIVSEHYYTAADGVLGAQEDHKVLDVPLALGLLTHCVLVLRNGFTVTGESACASPENFDAETGRKVARRAAVDKMWPLLGFRLRDTLSEGGGVAPARAPIAPAMPPIEIEFETLRDNNSGMLFVRAFGRCGPTIRRAEPKHIGADLSEDEARLKITEAKRALDAELRALFAANPPSAADDRQRDA